MFPEWLTIVFGLSAVCGLYLVVTIVRKLLVLYNNPNKIEVSATQPSETINIAKPGIFEIAVKRRGVFGIIPSDVHFQLVEPVNGSVIAVHQSMNYFGRKNMSGDRIVPVSMFTVITSGKYILHNLSPDKLKESDRLIIAPRTGMTGVFLVIALVFSSLLFIGGTVLTLIALTQ